jgi:hypothetical protein
MSVEEIEASNKQEVHPPMNFHKLQEQFLMFTVALLSNSIAGMLYGLVQSKSEVGMRPLSFHSPRSKI